MNCNPKSYTRKGQAATQGWLLARPRPALRSHTPRSSAQSMSRHQRRLGADATPPVLGCREPTPEDDGGREPNEEERPPVRGLGEGVSALEADDRRAASLASRARHRGVPDAAIRVAPARRAAPAAREVRRGRRPPLAPRGYSGGSPAALAEGPESGGSPAVAGRPSLSPRG